MIQVLENFYLIIDIDIEVWHRGLIPKVLGSLVRIFGRIKADRALLKFWPAFEKFLGNLYGISKKCLQLLKEIFFEIKNLLRF